MAIVVTTVFASPVGAHVTNDMKHLWSHLKGYALETFYSKAQSDTRYAGKSGVYTKAQSDARYPGATSVYSKTQTDTLVGASIPRVWADRDSSEDWRYSTGGTWFTVNSVSITAPADGCLQISGSSSVDNDGDRASFFLVPYLDDVMVTGVGPGLGIPADDPNAPLDFASISTTGVVAVTAGDHRVSQDVALGDGFSAHDFGFNWNNLVVTFYPQALCTVTLQTGGGATSATASGATASREAERPRHRE